MCPLSASPPEKFLLRKNASLFVSQERLRDSKARLVLPFAFLLASLSKQQINSNTIPTFFLRKEVIQPHLPIRLPCYDFTPVIRPAFDGSLLTVKSPASGISDSHGVTGGVYKTRERIHRDMLIRDY